jgi:hypothetical protein
MQSDFLNSIQSRAARIAVGPSAVRGKGHIGVSKAARSYLKTVDLSRFGTKKEEEFIMALDAATEELRCSLPKGAQKWGLARKVLNIFLRDCAYTIYLSEEYDLLLAEEFFEIPLDSITARELKRALGQDRLPRWPGVKHVTPQLSFEFQKAALSEAKKKRIARLHLDALWWSFSRD